MKTPAPTQQDSTYARLRQWVTVGQFLPGERLKIHAIAEQLGVGVMPVRAALQRLAAEGALVNVPHSGMIVPKLSLAEFDDVLQTRLLLEGEAAERGTHRLDAAGVAELLALEQQMRDALKVNDAKGYLDANELFHLRLYQAAASPTLLSLIETVWLKVGPLSNKLFEVPASLRVINEAHGDAVMALRLKDSAGVRRAIEKDLFVAGQFLRPFCAG
ncbi:MAG: GntR family transcriptional regulator [Hydrogenophaga sp.]|jgi:DNA-binding GntR family transcriptional regulator|uniref:GntR family transcriptional regulator n=1 Tax=Hydrogenophaga sp. TaxID=1904254 RepID=UPI0008CAF6ED|nr:GntR family transcriptional regulator [Hydrogenophaga sp.]MBU4181110.1 GntR family transcriptional regulator [Gammaproteobacteria bacterium]OGB33014.1 MAG: GntR family transcriptional regulator [Burkholderiales bacterium RIFCSPLOWO2_02_FULL_66_35]MBU4280405.1 GntR family transcriptional regulator [Gammaproteobacteria bacterium]MBU4324742.1 GntR family transcriptional regulator [Gammaproteobacteria bacterium]MBU4506332.1 GntR family transcriptional regulator [Gammaproteobacteria bacterium]